MFAQIFLLAAEAAEHAEDVEGEEPDPPRDERDHLGWFGVHHRLQLLAWKAWPAIKKALQDREDKIRGDLEHAESVRDQAETELADYQRQLADARNEAGRIIEEARQSAEQVRRT